MIKKLIEKLKLEQFTHPGTGSAIGFNQGLDKAIEIARQHTGWQPIATARPKLMELVLIGRSATAGIPAVQQCVWSGDAWMAIGLTTSKFINPTHWMPLPSPPEQGES